MSKFLRQAFSRNNTRSLAIWSAFVLVVWTVAWSYQKGSFDFGPTLFVAATWVLYTIVAWIAYNSKWR